MEQVSITKYVVCNPSYLAWLMVTNRLLVHVQRRSSAQRHDIKEGVRRWIA